MTNLNWTMTADEHKEIIEKATEEMCKSLNSFGPDETLKLLVRFANQDRIINELLVIYPTTVVLGEIFHKKPIYEIDEKTFQTLVDANPDIWMRWGKNSREDNLETHPKNPKKKNITKRKKRRISTTVTDRQDRGMEGVHVLSASEG